jgi:hypothetical protein
MGGLFNRHGGGDCGCDSGCNTCTSGGHGHGHASSCANGSCCGTSGGHGHGHAVTTSGCCDDGCSDRGHGFFSRLRHRFRRGHGDLRLR